MPHVKLENILGPPVREGLNTSKHLCLVCGCKALNLSHDRNLWFCFVCAVGGRIDAASYTAPTILRQSRRRYEYKVPTGRPMNSHRGISPEKLESLDCREGDCGELYLPLILNEVECGYVEHTESVYRVSGTRGVAVSSSGRGNWYVCEGMFDYLQIAALGFSCFYLCGNQPSSEQIGELFTWFQDRDRKVLICFDNDMPEMAERLKFRLSLILDNEIELLLPPTLGYTSLAAPMVKDWDDFIRTDREHAFEILKNA